MKERGRLLGNIQYKEDAWNLFITPIKFKSKTMTNGEEEISDNKTARLRDKNIKIRIKYKGDNLAIISAIRTLYTISYA